MSIFSRSSTALIVIVVVIIVVGGSIRNLALSSLVVPEKKLDLQYSNWSLCILSKPKDLMLTRKFVRRIKGIECKIFNGQTFEKAANLWP